MKNKFQKTFLAFAFLLVANFVMAQVPQGIPYQAVARDNAGNLIKNQNIALRFSIHDGTANGAVVYSETHSVTTDALGLFSVKIGGGTSSGTFANINWGSGAKFTQVALDVTGGDNYTDMGTTQMMSVPYALYAGSSGNSSSVSMGAIGQTSSSNGATITNGVLSLTPADATSGGVVTTGAQTFAGNKIFSANVAAGGTMGVGTTSPAASAVLDVNSTTQGFLPPRMTYAQRNIIANPAAGLIIYCIDCGNLGEMHFYNGSNWMNMTIGLGSIPFYVPTISTTIINSIGGPTASSGGNITSDGNTTVTSRGVCWSTSPSPSIALSTKTSEGTGTGSFISNITGLRANTTYYVRAYATNSKGTAYGNEVSFTSTNFLEIGQNYQGGKLAYILQPQDPGYDANVQHGLIAAPSDQIGQIWGCAFTAMGSMYGMSTAIGMGNQNTIAIISGCPTAYPAKACGDLVLNGYSDWFLPTKDELLQLFYNKVAIGGFSNEGYWSSSESNSTFVWTVEFTNGGPSIQDKRNVIKFRAVRAF